MKAPSFLPLLAAAAVALSPNVRAVDPEAPSAERGDLWEVTSTFTMEGMDFAMPAQTQRVCTAREWTEPPVADDERSKCETIDFKNTPTKSSWKLRCAGPPPMTGEGEITRSGPEAYKGWMKMTSPEGVMTMTISGRRVGDCDAGAQKRQVARMEAEAVAGQKLAEDARKQACRVPVETMDLRLLKAQSSYCTDPETKTAFCARLDSVEAFKAFCERGDRDSENTLEAVAAYCGRDPGPIRAAGCKQALEHEVLDVLGKCCAAEARELALRECAGRKYTELAGSKYQGFCLEYSRDVMAGGQNDPTPGDPKTGKPSAKKILKGLLNR